MALNRIHLISMRFGSPMKLAKKDNPMKNKLLLAIAISVILATRTAIAGAVHCFVTTAKSPASLTAYSHFSRSRCPDLFTPISVLSNDFGYVQWTEAKNSNLVNLVNFWLEDTSDGTVTAIAPILNQFPIVPDGTTVEVGTDGGGPVFATFNDNAQGSETVPDIGPLWACSFSL
jgi:hypothetical protein